jgi:lariat debranching enzyme
VKIGKMKIAIEGCCHGDLNIIYETIKYAEKLNDFKVDLLICCGDFESIRYLYYFKIETKKT